MRCSNEISDTTHNGHHFILCVCCLHLHPHTHAQTFYWFARVFPAMVYKHYNFFIVFHFHYHRIAHRFHGLHLVRFISSPISHLTHTPSPARSAVCFFRSLLLEINIYLKCRLVQNFVSMVSFWMVLEIYYVPCTANTIHVHILSIWGALTRAIHPVHI